MQDFAKVETLAELLMLHDDKFIQSAYVSILGRQPDVGGLEHYLELLRTGTPKLDILTELASSEEGRAFLLKPQHIDSRTPHRSRRRIQAKGANTRRQPFSDYHIRTTVDSLGVLNDSINATLQDQQRQLVQINRTLLELSRAVSRTVPASQTSHNDVTSIESSTAIKADHRTLLDQLSPYAREIFEQLDSASTHLAGNHA
ncbi:MAG: DUF4214 domain-containing protein [Burkholderia gladioli]